jgi:YD repeat-containing protein
VLIFGRSENLPEREAIMRNWVVLLIVFAAGCRTQAAKLQSNDSGLGGVGGAVVTGGAIATGGAGLGGAGGAVVTGGATATGGVVLGGAGGAVVTGGAIATGGVGLGGVGGAVVTGGATATSGIVLGGAGGAVVTGGATATDGAVSGTGGEPATGNGGSRAVGSGDTDAGGLGGVSATGGAGGSFAGGATSAGTASTGGQSGARGCAFVGPCTRTVTYTYGDSVSVNKTSFFYDANNRLIREELDSNGDGAPEYVIRYSYDEHGWLLEVKSDGCGSDGSVTSCRWLSYTYDAQGNVLTENDRSFYSGRIDGCTAYTYDSSGHLLKTEFSGRCSGTVQDVAIYTYDSAWRLISKAWEYNGTPGDTTTYQYDAAGLLVSEVRGAKQDEVVTYTRNAAGLPLVEEHRMAAGSLADSYRIIRTYDSAGNQLTERTKYLTGVSVGTDEFCSTNTYDQCGNVLTYDSWNSCDQPVVSRTTYTYECFAR